jgi:peroxiredoxin
MVARTIIVMMMSGALLLSIVGCKGGNDANSEVAEPKATSLQTSGHVHGGPKVGQKAPPFTLNDVNGTPTDITEMIGKKPLVLVFWGTWCPHCVSEVPSLNRMQDSYNKDGAQVVSVAVRHPTESRADFPKTIAEFVADRKINYTVLLDAEHSASNLYQLHGVPTLLVLDKEGVIQSSGHSAREAEAKLRQLI